MYVLYMYACHRYADHHAINGTTSYFAQAYALIPRVANEHLCLN